MFLSYAIMATFLGKFRKLFGRCVEFCGLILVIIALVLVFEIDMVYLQSTAEQSEGTVVEVQRKYLVDRPGRESGLSPLVRFQVGTDALEIQGPITIGLSPYSVGDKVTVIYPKGRPEAGRIKSSKNVFLMPLVFGVAGVLFGLLGHCIVRLAKRDVAASQASVNVQPH